MISSEEISRRFARGELAAEAICDAALRAANARPELGALLHINETQARAQATELDKRRRDGLPLSPLAGVPIIVKDNLVTRGIPTTCASKILTRNGSLESAWLPPYDAHVIERLKASGAILLAKANLDEFGMGSSNENSAFFPTKNPWDLSRAPGGSSGGSAASVASGLAPIALGSDTGGSIRQPAAFTGCVGLKPTYGRVSRYGLVAFASSLDVVGPIGATVRDVAAVFDCIAGPDPRDATCASTHPENTLEQLSSSAAPLAGLKIGLPEEYFAEGLDSAVAAQLNNAIDALKQAGAQLIPLSLPGTHHGIATYYVLAAAEASSNLSRFDGVHFGYRAERSANNLSELYKNTRGKGFGAEVKRRIMLGTYLLSAGYYDAYYRKAQKARARIRQELQSALAQVDLLLTPTTPTPAFGLGEKAADPLSMYLADIYTLPPSLAGLPALSLPCGLAKPSVAGAPALPVGCQLIGRAFSEAQLLRVAYSLENLLSEARGGSPFLASCPQRSSWNLA